MFIYKHLNIYKIMKIGPKSWVITVAAFLPGVASNPSASTISFTALEGWGKLQKTVLLLRGLSWFGRKVRKSQLLDTVIKSSHLDVKRMGKTNVTAGRRWWFWLSPAKTSRLSKTAVPNILVPGTSAAMRI